MPEDAEDPRDYILPIWPKHKGKTLAAISETDSGLTDLEWVSKQKWLYKTVRSRLKSFLKLPDISLRIRALSKKEKGPRQS